VIEGSYAILKISLFICWIKYFALKRVLDEGYTYVYFVCGGSLLITDAKVDYEVNYMILVMSIFGISLHLTTIFLIFAIL